MSGGHWNYSGFRIQDALVEISEDEEVKSRWPLIAGLFTDLGQFLHEIEHDMDWDLSSDSVIPDDTKFDKESVGKLLEAVLKVSPDKWFPRGKWATIQAIQGRKEPTEGG